jgi:hypothetical protein
VLVAAAMDLGGCDDGGYEGYEIDVWYWWRGADVEVLDLVLRLYG